MSNRARKQTVQEFDKMAPQTHTLLSALRARTTVDCDTLDVSVAESLGPFEDCTSNQAIAYAELLHTHHADLVKASAASAREVSARFVGIRVESLAVEICVSGFFNSRLVSSSMMIWDSQEF